ncbi:deoxyribose-phosphate aldolase [Roseospira visakhapatnamensis]|uniref:Deoxyribose-phosphate aldolase n=1 Tax=Roseospira visakhapatnamensis TaxID=390880 RepID=A0A7W6RDJ8_9PROT|nr:deoxyribose-phosphate aldolase [Roseospira visakhapatnamensis]MBB4266482.1 deoxyribose-phosphate aldolase [Roseospira visakhapatnamensis]
MPSDAVALKPADLAAFIDHTILAPDAQAAAVARLCDEARAHGFRSVCVNPLHVPAVAAALAGSAVLTCSVIGFPFGATPTDMKEAEARWVVAHGAQEVDMVLSIGQMKDGDHAAVLDDIRRVKAACGAAVLKVILENGLLSDAEKVAACLLSREAGADFVKTSTGFLGGGATAEDVALMRRTVGDSMGVKASGGVRTYADAVRMIQAGASRIGASASIAIVTNT